MDTTLMEEVVEEVLDIMGEVQVEVVGLEQGEVALPILTLVSVLK